MGESAFTHIIPPQYPSQNMLQGTWICILYHSILLLKQVASTLCSQYLMKITITSKTVSPPEQSNSQLTVWKAASCKLNSPSAFSKFKSGKASSVQQKIFHSPSLLRPVVGDSYDPVYNTNTLRPWVQFSLSGIEPHMAAALRYRHNGGMPCFKGFVSRWYVINRTVHNGTSPRHYITLQVRKGSLLPSFRCAVDRWRPWRILPSLVSSMCDIPSPLEGGWEGANRNLRWSAYRISTKCSNVVY